MKIAIIGGFFALIVAITQIIIPAVIHSPDPAVPSTPIVVNVTPLITYPPPVAEHFNENPAKEITKSINNDLIFTDYFSQKDSYWSTFPDDPNCKIYFDDGTLKFDFISISNTEVVYYSDLVGFTIPRDFIVEFDAIIESDSEYPRNGIMLRKVDDENYYVLYFSLGLYQFVKFINNEYTTIIPWTSSSAINKGAATNTIKVKCEGDSFTFYINGNEVNSCTDTTFPAGHLSLAAGFNGGLSGDNIFSFDNFKIWSINN